MISMQVYRIRLIDGSVVEISEEYVRLIVKLLRY